MRTVLTLALNDVWITLKDRPLVVWTVVMPLVFVFAFSGMHRAGQPSPVSLAVLDEDGTFLSRALREALGREGFAVWPVTSEDAAAGAAGPRCLRIPAGFQERVSAGEPAPVYLRPESDAAGEYSMTAKLHVQQAIARILVDLVTAYAAGPGPGRGDPGPAAAAELGSIAGDLLGAPDEPPPALVFDEPFQEAFRAAAARSAQVRVTTETAGRGRPVPAGMRMSLPAILTLFVLVNTGVYGAAMLAAEKQTGVLPRLATFAVRPSSILIGKLLGRTLFALAQAVILLAGGRLLFGAPLGGSLAGLAILVLCLALAVGALAFFWGSILRRADQVMAVVLVGSLFLGAMGGCWWPLEIVPGWLRIAGHLSPTAWAMDGFHALISFGLGAGAVLVPCLVLLAYAALFTALGGFLLRPRA